MNTFLSWIAGAVIIIPAFLLAISIHEFSHAAVSYLLGDDTAKKIGRLSLNPFVHIDFLGMLFLLVFGIGWAVPVPFDPRNFKFPRIYAVLVGLAGPLSNFVLALIMLYAIHYFPGALPVHITKSFMQIFNAILAVNVMLGLFNLLPIPPLDGGHLVNALIPESRKDIYFFIQRYGIFVLLFLLILPQTNQYFVYAIHKTISILEGLVIKV